MGRKPERGGRPARERRIRGVTAVSAGVLAQEVASVLRVVDELILKTMKVEKVMKMYMVSARSASCWLNCITKSIQPR